MCLPPISSVSLPAKGKGDNNGLLTWLDEEAGADEGVSWAGPQPHGPWPRTVALPCPQACLASTWPPCQQVEGDASLSDAVMETKSQGELERPRGREEVGRGCHSLALPAAHLGQLIMTGAAGETEWGREDKAGSRHRSWWLQPRVGAVGTATSGHKLLQPELGCDSTWKSCPSPPCTGPCKRKSCVPVPGTPQVRAAPSPSGCHLASVCMGHCIAGVMGSRWGFLVPFILHPGVPQEPDLPLWHLFVKGPVPCPCAPALGDPFSQLSLPPLLS